jgi:hypothetical protein
LRTLALCLIAAAISVAQVPPGPPAGPNLAGWSGVSSAGRALVYGVLIERDAAAPSGQFAVRLATNEVLRYRFDAKTYVVRNDALIDVPRVLPGEKIEVLSDAVPGSPLRYARDVHVLSDAPVPVPAALRAPAASSAFNVPVSREPYSAFDDTFLYTGDLTISGVVARITADRLVLHTRTGEQAVEVRNDTRFLNDGAIAAAADLKPNTRVFVKAGKGLYGQLEAYQIIWGDILAPK